MENLEDRTYLCKVLAFGFSGIGKTDLLKKIADSYFARQYKMTTGVDIFSKEIETESLEMVRLSIWDISESERFETLRRQLYKQAEGAMLIFDLSQESTLHHIIKRYEELSNIRGKIPFILIGIHKLPSEKGNIESLRELAYRFATNQWEPYVETSLEDFKTVEIALTELSSRMVELRKKKK
jgi:small GTP-binding protein